MRRHPQGDEKKHCFKKTHGVILICFLSITAHANFLLKPFK